MDTPPFKGGQGRSAEDVEGDGRGLLVVVGVAFALAFSIGAWLLLGWIAGLF